MCRYKKFGHFFPEGNCEGFFFFFGGGRVEYDPKFF